MFNTYLVKCLCSMLFISVFRLNEDDSRISSNEPIEIVITVDDCIVNYIEHVELVINVRYGRRGAVEIQLRSPLGEVSLHSLCAWYFS